MLKELTLLGYFTSEIGYTQAMRYVETPGRFEPCITYTTGDKAWAPHAGCRVRIARNLDNPRYPSRSLARASRQPLRF
jgi:hypothetical protein